MTVYTKNFNTSCLGPLLLAINNDSSIDNVLDQIVQNSDTGTADFNFQGSLTTGEESSLNSILSSWSCPTELSVDKTHYEMFADQLLNPSTSDWAVSNIASPFVDTNDNDLIVRRFDDTTEEGIGFQIKTPISLSTFRIIFRARAQSAPGSNSDVYLKLYFKEIPDGGTVGTWQNYELGSVLIPSGSTDWHYRELTLASSTLGLSENTVYLMEMTRDVGNINDTLVGDFSLLNLEIELY